MRGVEDKVEELFQKEKEKGSKDRTQGSKDTKTRHQSKRPSI